MMYDVDCRVLFPWYLLYGDDIPGMPCSGHVPLVTSGIAWSVVRSPYLGQLVLRLPLECLEHPEHVQGQLGELHLVRHIPHYDHLESMCCVCCGVAGCGVAWCGVVWCSVV